MIGVLRRFRCNISSSARVKDSDRRSWSQAVDLA